MRASALSLLILASCGVEQARAEAAKPPIGARVENFTLSDYHGKSHSIDALGANKIVVLAFLGTECPLAKLYAPRLAELSNKYGRRGVAVIGIDSNRQDAATEIAAFARANRLAFPILKDLNQRLADAAGVTRTPEVVVLDAGRTIRYRGRIDDQYGFDATNANYQKKQPEKKELVDALEAMLAGQPVAQAETPSAGCLLGRDLQPQSSSPVTYSNQVVRILNTHCVFCHREGQIAPFSLAGYEDAAGWASMIAEVVDQGRMPPWHASPQHGRFRNDARLSDEDKATIAAWVAAGAPEGDRAQLPQPPKFAEGWMIPRPDEVLYMSKTSYPVPATGVVDYQMFTVDPGWKEDRWIKAIEPRPGNPAVVHHILLFVIPPGADAASIGVGGTDFLAAFAPGLRAEPLPDGLARFVPAGSKLIFQMHYTPNGTPQQDRSYCGFVFADPKAVKKEVRVSSAVNFVFQIPPQQGEFPVKSRYVFGEDTQLLSLMPHMHLRGKAFRYEVTYPDGRSEVLLDVPRYDFGWQTSYELAEPKLMPRGTRMDCYAVFDNSEDNLNNPNPKATVGFGDQTFDEMMIGFFDSARAHEDRQNPAAPRPLSRLDQFNVIMASTQGEPDDNIKVGTLMALRQPDLFDDFSFVLRTMVPQLDRVCLTGVQDGKLKEVIGPRTLRRKSAGRADLLDPLPSVPPKDESLGDYASTGQVVVNDELAKAGGKLMAEMRRRGARSSLHVPAQYKGQPVTVNFWSTDANAFPPPAQAFLTAIAQAMTNPRGQ